MSTEVEICNDALANIRAQSINSLTETSREAQLCKLKYPLIRDRVLREINWGFATKYIALTLLQNVTPARWLYAYDYPNDALKIQNVMVEQALKNNSYSALKYRESYEPDYVEPDYSVPYMKTNIDDKIIIACDSENVIAQYTSRVRNVELFDPIFKMMLGYGLAAELVIPVFGHGKGKSVREDMLRAYNDLRLNAIKEDDEESNQLSLRPTEFETGRM